MADNTPPTLPANGSISQCGPMRIRNTIKTVSPSTLYNKLASSGFLVLDARSATAFSESHIKTALNVDVQAIKSEGAITIESITKWMPKASLPRWRSRVYSDVYIYDEDGAERGPARLLADIICNEVKTKEKEEKLKGATKALSFATMKGKIVAVVEQGFTAFCKQYSYLCITETPVHGGLPPPSNNHFVYPSEILPGMLYHGGVQSAHNLAVLRHLNIRRIVNVTAELTNPFESLGDAVDLDPLASGEPIVYFQRPIDDHPFEDIRQHFSETIAFIEDAHARGHPVLVHCAMGVSRSSTIVLAFLMKTRGWPLRKAYKYLKRRRPFVNPNIGFLRQLIEFETELFGEPSLRIDTPTGRRVWLPTKQKTRREDVDKGDIVEDEEYGRILREERDDDDSEDENDEEDDEEEVGGPLVGRYAGTPPFAHLYQ